MRTIHYCACQYVKQYIEARKGPSSQAFWEAFYIGALATDIARADGVRFQHIPGKCCRIGSKTSAQMGEVGTFRKRLSKRRL